MHIADLLEEQIPKVASINGGADMDVYIVKHLVECAMTLISTFEAEVRLVKIIKSMVKVIEKSKERAFSRDLKSIHNSVRTSLMGLNKKLEENEIQIKIQIWLVIPSWLLKLLTISLKEY